MITGLIIASAIVSIIAAICSTVGIFSEGDSVGSKDDLLMIASIYGMCLIPIINIAIVFIWVEMFMEVEK